MQFCIFLHHCVLTSSCHCIDSWMLLAPVLCGCLEGEKGCTLPGQLALARYLARARSLTRGGNEAYTRPHPTFNHSLARLEYSAIHPLCPFHFVGTCQASVDCYRGPRKNFVCQPKLANWLVSFLSLFAYLFIYLSY